MAKTKLTVAEKAQIKDLKSFGLSSKAAKQHLKDQLRRYAQSYDLDPQYRHNTEALKELKEYKDKAKASKAKVAKKMARKAAKKTVGKALKKLVPGVGAAAIAHDVLKGVSKATCSKRGGKWASGKCVGAKKTKFKPGSKVKDPISKR